VTLPPVYPASSLYCLLSGYGSAIHEFRVALREEYEDLLHELARGMPRDGVNGRPLGRLACPYMLGFALALGIFVFAIILFLWRLSNQNATCV